MLVLYSQMLWILQMDIVMEDEVVWCFMFQLWYVVYYVQEWAEMANEDFALAHLSFNLLF